MTWSIIISPRKQWFNYHISVLLYHQESLVKLRGCSVLVLTTASCHFQFWLLTVFGSNINVFSPSFHKLLDYPIIIKNNSSFCSYQSALRHLGWYACVHKDVVTAPTLSRTDSSKLRLLFDGAVDGNYVHVHLLSYLGSGYETNFLLLFSKCYMSHIGIGAKLFASIGFKLPESAQSPVHCRSWRRLFCVWLDVR